MSQNGPAAPLAPQDSPLVASKPITPARNAQIAKEKQREDTSQANAKPASAPAKKKGCHIL